MAGVLSTTERVPQGDDELVDRAASDSVGDHPAAASDPTRFALPATADIRVVGEILARCRGALEAEGDVVVDCADVERVDAAALQCLGALHGSLVGAGRLLTIAAPTAVFQGAVDALGFDEVLGLRRPGGASAPGSA